MDRLFFRSRFELYAGRFDLTDGRNQLKLLHTGKVCEVMERLTEMLGFSERIRDLAWLCALFHDVARFEQVVRFETFVDALSFDHADRGCEIIMEEGFLDALPEEDRSRVLTAIGRHNKYEIGPVSDEETLLLCKLIRDADKCDIFRVFACENMVDTMGETVAQVCSERITDVVMESVLAHRCVNKDDRRTGLDKWIGFLGFIHDLYFPESVKIVREEGYYRKQFDEAVFEDEETARRIDTILESLEQYMDHVLEG